jgi:short-subunit dehydrogenase
LTGATGGLGQAIARALHARGAQLILTGRRGDVLDQLQEELGGSHRQLPADLADAQGAAALAEAAGDVDVLVANAALPASGPIDDFAPVEIDRALDVNLRAPIQLARVLLPGMLERGHGQLVFVSSLSGKVGTNGSALYSATKFGLRGLAQGMREDLHGSGVGVTAINPGFVRDAGMFAESGAQLPRFVGTTTPERVAEAVISGIERDRAEIDVAPLGVRAGTRFAMLAPALAAGVQRRFGAEKIASAIASGQREKR